MDRDSAHVSTKTGPDVAPAAQPEAPSTRRAGEVIAGKYVLGRRVGEGGMAEVWLATHESLRSEVAIKFVSERLAQDGATAPHALERFRFEAQISARLATRTRHVVAVHDAGVHAGAPYLVMEFVPGHTLEQEIDLRGPVAPARFAEVLEQVADALGAAHALGIVHRDLKPSNLLLTPEPDGRLTVKVADFGVAKALDAGLALDRPRETMEGAIIGSPAFMSPEQLTSAGRVDARTDVWSLGVLAYEALTGRPCFEGRNVMDLFAEISVTRYTLATRVRPELPRAVDAWLARAISRKPEDRFASVAEMNRAFRAALASPPRRGLRGIVAAVLLAAAALLAVGLVRRAYAPEAAVAPGPRATSNGVPAQAPAAPVATTAAPAIDVGALPDVPQAPAGTAAPPPAQSPRVPAKSAPPAAPAAPEPVPAKPRKIDPSEIQ